MRLLLLLLLFILLCMSCGSNKSINSSSHNISKTALTILESRQREYKGFKEKTEIDILADKVLDEIFCPNGNCTDGAKDTLKAIKNVLRYPQTKYETKLERYYLSIDLFTIETILKEEFGYQINQIYVFPSNCRCYNAMAIPLEKWKLHDFYLLEVNNGLSLDVGELAKVSSRLLPFTDRDTITKFSKNQLAEYLSGEYKTLEDFGVKLVGHLFAEVTPDKQSLDIDESKIQYYNAFFRTMKSFVIAHEYSHALLKHKASYSSITFIPENNKREKKVTVADYPSKVKELEADSLAFEIILKYSENKNHFKNEAVIAGVELWYLWLDMFQKMELLTFGEFKGEESHPSAIERRNYIRSTFQSRIPQNEDYRNLIETLELTFQIYWEFMKPRFQTVKEILKDKSKKNECFKRM